MDSRRLFGNKSEKKAERFLKKKGYTILDRQFTSQYGEIDLIAQDGEEVVFVEVKARRSAAFGHPEESVTKSKIKKIAATGEIYLQKHQLVHRSYRIEVIAIDPDGEIHHIAL